MSASLARLPEHAFVYVIGAKNGPQKVGIAVRPNGRLALLQTGNPLDLVITTAVAVSRQEARAIEVYAHHLLRENWTRGEWFNVAPEEAAAAVNAAIIAVRSGKRVKPPPSAERRGRGRPKVGATLVGVRLPPDQLAALDAWIARQPDPKPSRPEALRRLAEAQIKPPG